MSKGDFGFQTDFSALSYAVGASEAKDTFSDVWRRLATIEIAQRRETELNSFLDLTLKAQTVLPSHEG